MSTCRVPAVRRHPAAVSDIIRHLGHSQEEMDQPILDLTWDYPVKGEIAEPDAEAVLAEINGWDARGRPSPPTSSSATTVLPPCATRRTVT